MLDLMLLSALDEPRVGRDSKGNEILLRYQGEHIRFLRTDENGNYFIFKIVKDKIIKFYQHINTHNIYIEQTASGKTHVIQNFDELKINKIIFIIHFDFKYPLNLFSFLTRIINTPNRYSSI